MSFSKQKKKEIELRKQNFQKMKDYVENEYSTRKGIIESPSGFMKEIQVKFPDINIATISNHYYKVRNLYNQNLDIPVNNKADSKTPTRNFEAIKNLQAEARRLEQEAKDNLAKLQAEQEAKKKEQEEAERVRIAKEEVERIMREDQLKQEEELKKQQEELKKKEETDPMAEDKPTATLSREQSKSYKRGMLVRVKVLQIRTYGAIVETDDEYNTPGLIHISQITNNGFVSDVNKYFRVDDFVNAQVVDVDHTYNRLSLTTKNLPLVERGVKPAVVEPVFEVKPNPIPTTAKEVTLMLDHESKQLLDFVTSKIGTLTPEAEEAFKKLIKENSLFAVSFNLATVIPNFQPDIGLILAEQLKTAINRGSL